MDGKPSDSPSFPLRPLSHQVRNSISEPGPSPLWQQRKPSSPYACWWWLEDSPPVASRHSHLGLQPFIHTDPGQSSRLDQETQRRDPAVAHIPYPAPRPIRPLWPNPQSKMFTATLLLTALSASAPWIADIPQTPQNQLAGGIGDHGQVPFRGSSPFNVPPTSDTVFAVDEAPGLDTGCTFRSGGPLVFDIEVTRYLGDIQTLLANGLLKDTARLQMPAFDVDFNAVVTGIEPERDKVYFNGNLVNEVYLTGDNNVWKLNNFNIPIDWINFPTAPGSGAPPTPAINTIMIEIDTANAASGTEAWCTAIDWASLEIEVVRPIVFVPRPFKAGDDWNQLWVPNVNALGILNDNSLDMSQMNTISANSALISAKVDEVAMNWGVDKVVLVTHSKAGVDARHYAENSDKVSQLIQLGPPNAGTRLANVIVAKWIKLREILAAGLVNKLQSPGGKQMTTTYMGIYNATHGRNPDVRYTALAGMYDPACPPANPLCRPYARKAIKIVGEGDVFVAKDSAHALGYTDNRMHSSSATNKSAFHLKLEDAAGAYAAVEDLIRALDGGSTSSGPQPPPAAAPGDDFAQIGTWVSDITQGGQLVVNATIDHTGPLTIMLFFPSGEQDLTLLDPNGITWDAAAAAGSSVVEFEQDEVLGGFIEVFEFEAGVEGNWVFTVDAPSVTEPGGIAGVGIAAFAENPTLTFEGSFDDSSISINEPLIITGTLLENGLPVTGQDVFVTVALPDDSTVQLNLFDDGIAPDQVANDGIYTGSFTNTSQAGTYDVLYCANEPGNVPATFTRESVNLATVATSTSTVSGPYADAGNDTDLDTLFNFLDIDVGLMITDALTYRVIGELQDSQGNTHMATFEGALTVGANTVTLSFPGEALYQNGVDGPYDLTKVTLVEYDQVNLLPVQELTNAYTTQGYTSNQFEHAPISIPGTGTDTGVDNNNNNLFDELVVDLDVLVDVAGNYDWSARLVDPQGTEIGFAAGTATFAAGANILSILFGGSQIGQNGVDGPYSVRDLLIFSGSTSTVLGQVYNTSGYGANQFEGFTGPGLSGFGTAPPFFGRGCSVVEKSQASYTELILILAGIAACCRIARRRCNP